MVSECCWFQIRVCALHISNPARQHCLCFVQSDAIWKFSQSHVQIWSLTYELTVRIRVSSIHEMILYITALPTLVGYTLLLLHVNMPCRSTSNLSPVVSLLCKVSSPKMIMRSFEKLTSNVRVLMEITFSLKQDTWQINWKIQSCCFFLQCFHFLL